MGVAVSPPHHKGAVAWPSPRSPSRLRYARHHRRRQYGQFPVVDDRQPDLGPQRRLCRHRFLLFARRDDHTNNGDLAKSADLWHHRRERNMKTGAAQGYQPRLTSTLQRQPGGGLSRLGNLPQVETYDVMDGARPARSVPVWRHRGAPQPRRHGHRRGRHWFGLSTTPSRAVHRQGDHVDDTPAEKSVVSFERSTGRLVPRQAGKTRSPTSWTTPMTCV